MNPPRSPYRRFFSPIQSLAGRRIPEITNSASFPSEFFSIFRKRELSRNIAVGSSNAAYPCSSRDVPEHDSMIFPRCSDKGAIRGEAHRDHGVPVTEKIDFMFASFGVPQSD